MPYHQYAHVVIPRPFSQAFDYLIPKDLDVSPGDFVRVPFGKIDLIGVVMALKAETSVTPQKIKSISEVVLQRGLSAEGISFLKWMATYTLMPIGQIFKMMVSVPAAFDPLPMKVGYQVQKTCDISRLTPKQQQLFDMIIDESQVYSVAELQDLTGVSAAVVKAACERGAFVKKQIAPVFSDPNPAYTDTVYEEAQKTVVDALKTTIKSQRFEAILLHGVTGSGKTEVYFEAIAQALRDGKQSLVLLPEISLTPQFLERFDRRFGCHPALWHSQMTAAQRRDTYKAIIDGTVKVVVGARSSLFLPYKNLGVVIVDEEHEGSYKQEEGGIYHARDMAVAKGYHYDIPVVLVSATPSLESFVNAKEGKYTLLTLPHRHGGADLPAIHMIDMRSHEKKSNGDQRFLSEPLCEKLAQNFCEGEQSLLFLNRRGYAPLTLCRACGERLECPNCSSWVVLHRVKGHDILLCHHCGFKTGIPETCCHCGTKDTFVNCGPGVERIAEEIKTIMPQARTLIMSSDSFDTTQDMIDAIARIQAGEIDIIIGTQMMAKGHHFPKLTLVGIVDADLGLTGGDLRACEKTYQLLQQVSGRCGRSERKGDVYLQTYYPDHLVLKSLAAGDDDAYREQEMLMRQMAEMPPFSKLAALIVSGPDQQAVEEWVRTFSKHRPQSPGLDILGPAPAPLAKLRRQYRYRFLLKCPKKYPLQAAIKDWLKRYPAPRFLRVAVDIDPIQFM